MHKRALARSCGQFPDRAEKFLSDLGLFLNDLEQFLSDLGQFLSDLGIPQTSWSTF